MTIAELNSTLATNPGRPLKFALPSGETIPPHFHITEVGFVKKEFIDCGGKIRTEGKCVLQVWVATDVDHRVNSDKLTAILAHGAPVLPTDALPVEIEYNNPGLTYFPLESAGFDGEALTLQLVHRHTDCLAKDVCGVPDPEGDASCSPGSGCC